MLDQTIGLIKGFFAGQDSISGFAPRSQRMPFMFEFHDKNGQLMSTDNLLLNTFVFPVNPESYSCEIAPLTQITKTMSGGFVDTIGSTMPKINMQGTFGFTGTFNPRAQQSDPPEKKSGWKIYNEFESQFKIFYNRFGTHWDTGEKTKVSWSSLDEKPEIAFFNFTDAHYYYVVINHFRVMRNINRRFLYQYELSMTATRKIAQGDVKKKDDIEQKFNSTPSKPDASTLSSFEKVAKIALSIAPAVTSLVSAVQQDIKTLTEQAAMVRNGVSAVIAAPYELVNSVVQGIRSINATLTSFSTVPNEVICTLRETTREMLNLAIHPEMFFDTGVSVNCYGTTSIGHDDNLETLAYRNLGDSRRWDEIATLNKLEYPYIADTLSQTVSATKASGVTPGTIAAGAITINVGLTLIPGDVVLLTSGTISEVATVLSYSAPNATLTTPIINSYPSGSAASSHERVLNVVLTGSTIKIPQNVIGTRSITMTEPDRLFGCDEFLNDAGDHERQATGLSANATTKTVTGYDNLIMQLQHRLNTRRGELAALGHPEYGCNLPLFIGKIGVDYWYERALLEAETAIREDPRVQDVTNLSLSADSTAVYLLGDIIPIGSKSAAPLRLTIGA
jgi:hypothetical protein